MAGARDAALKVLGRVEKDSAFAAAALASELKGFRDKREAAFATDIVLGVLRRRPLLDHLLERASKRGLKKTNPLVMNILRIGAYQIVFMDRVPASAAVSEAVDQTRKLNLGAMAGFVNAVLRRVAKSMDQGDVQIEPKISDTLETSALCFGLPKWLFERLVLDYGRDRAFATAQALNRPSKRTLRINTNRIDIDQALATLGKDAKKGELSPFSVEAKSVEKAAPLINEGVAVYQDEGSQLVCLALDPKPKERILDACAGRGGKTSAIAMMTSGKADITASDRSESKLARLSLELSRQGFYAKTAEVDLVAEPEKLSSGYDKILLDAPCSGTGTIGRRPEIRLRIAQSSVDSLVKIQSAMLNAAAGLLAPKGRLVYAVCSLLPEEGMGQANGFLDANPSFKFTKQPPNIWPDRVPWNQGACLVEPGICGTDGYQILCFTKD